MFRLRVIVLEDHAFQRSIAVNMLRQLGCKEVFEAADGAEALAVLQRVGPVDIALCDLKMEGTDGLEFMQKVKNSRLVDAIIISSSLPHDLRRTVGQIVPLLKLKLLGDVGKPLHYETLEKLLKKHLTAPPINTNLGSAIDHPSEAAVRYAIATNEFCSYFQPKFHLRTGEVNGVEVLARWAHPSRGVMSPAFFMPVLESSGLMDELLFQQIRQSLVLQRQAKKHGHSLNFAFNVQAAQLSNSNLVPQIKALLAEFSLPGSDLTFELTESGLLDVSNTNLESLFRLRMLGCSLSIDDFGAGFSSLQRLCQLPFNEIKLDGEFAQKFINDPSCRAVINNTVALGQSLGMSVVIEGIETDEQRLKLLELGCTQGQGYLYARPMSGANFLRWLDEAAFSSARRRWNFM